MIDLPRNWQGSEAVFNRARMTRDGKPKPAPQKPDDSALSAPAPYREFLKDETTTLARYKGTVDDWAYQYAHLDNCSVVR